MLKFSKLLNHAGIKRLQSNSYERKQTNVWKELPMKRKPAPFSGRKYFIILALIAVAFFAIDAVISSANKSTRAEIAKVAAENDALEAELRDLQDELAFIKTDEGIELYARAQGMCKPGEIHYDVNPGQ